MTTPFPLLHKHLTPKNGDRKFDWQKILTHKEICDTKTSIKRIVFEENKDNDGFVTCCYCNCKLDYEHTTLEHKFPQCFGGSYIKANLEPCCARCNNERGINFGHFGEILNVGMFKCPPLKTSTMQEKLATLMLLRIYSLIRKKDIKDVTMDEALSYFYDGIISNEDMLKKIPKIYRTFLDSAPYNPWYKKIYNKIMNIFKKKELEEQNTL